MKKDIEDKKEIEQKCIGMGVYINPKFRCFAYSQDFTLLTIQMCVRVCLV